MKKIVTLTGADGNMGKEVLKCTAKLEGVTMRLLLLNGTAQRRFAASAKRKYGNIEIVYGDLADLDTCRKIVDGAAYVVNCAAVIPPKSDKYPLLAKRCNEDGVKTLLQAIKESENSPKLIHISTVALYGNRNYLHPWGRVGDPLLPSAFDVYAATKLKGERLVLESGLKYWVVLRQTAMLHDRMLTDNMSDGLMFHTCFNTPLEWVTAKDSGMLIKNIIEKDMKGELDNESMLSLEKDMNGDVVAVKGSSAGLRFWKRVYNIGGGAENRKTGYDTFDEGFGIIGGSAEEFLKPGWNTIRNFHGLWFDDGQELEKLFRYQRQSVADYWQEILSKHPYYRVAKLLPPSLISKIAIQRLLKDDNAPQKWIKSGEKGKIKAYFGSEENLANRPRDWKGFCLLSKGRLPDGDIDYEELKSNEARLRLRLSHGYDESKQDCELSLADMRMAAEFRGGKCLSAKMTKGDLYTPLCWECCDGHRFYAAPYTVIKAGHWCPDCQPEPWDYDRLAKKMPFYAQVWYDTHARGENYRYYYDENGIAAAVKISELDYARENNETAKEKEASEFIGDKIAAACDNLKEAV